MDRYKNWPEICKVGEVDQLIMMVLALLDFKNPLAARLIKAFPECFSDTQVRGPVPLSVMKRMAAEQAVKEHIIGSPDNAEDWMVDYDVCSTLHIPVFIYTTGEKDRRTHPDAPRLPSEVDENACVGDVVQHSDRQYVVIQTEDQEALMYLIPAECVDVNL